MNEGCRLIQARIAAAMTETQTSQQIREIRAHMRGCRACRSFPDALQMDDRRLTEFADATKPVLERIEAQVMGALNSQAVAQRTRPRLARSHMRFAVAATLVLGLFPIVVHLLSLLAAPSVTLAQTLDAMRDASWIHVLETSSSPEGGVRESWECFEPHIIARKETDGRTIYANYAENVRYSYNPNSNKITVSFTTDNYMIARPRTSWERLAQNVQVAEASGAKVTRKKGEVNGMRVERIVVDYADNPQVESVLFVRDIGRNLLIQTEATVLRNGRRSIHSEAYDYPK
ncbi:MAG: hypothetical protein JW993_01065 [Sedimentisphaerales bacterium]|nr:hypothetical protein [Sedimentisphaerales bacterium]